MKDTLLARSLKFAPVAALVVTATTLIAHGVTNGTLSFLFTIARMSSDRISSSGP